MRILFLTHRIPYPPNKGDKIRSYNILKYLSGQHEVHLVTLIDDPQDLAYISPLSGFVQSLAFDTINPYLKKLIAATAIFKSSSISVSYFYSRKLQDAVDKLLRRQHFDALICSSSPMAEYLFRSAHLREKLQRSLWLMDLIDVDSCKWGQYADRCSGVKRWIYAHESRCLSKYERKIIREFDFVLLVSEQEKNLLLKSFSAMNVSTVSNGVDLEYFTPKYDRGIPKRGPVLVFTGVMDYWPNIDGVVWFVREIFPEIRKRFPDLSLYIVGGRPSSSLQRLVRVPGVHVTGFVDDVRDYLTAADICIVPLRIARGIQNKVLEAFAMGKAVVCTPQALEGIRATPGRDVLVADDACGFTDCVVRLLQDEASRVQLEINGRRCVEAGYSWGKNLATLERLLGSCQVDQFQEAIMQRA